MAKKDRRKCKGVDPATGRTKPGYRNVGGGRCPQPAKAKKPKAGTKRPASVVSRKAYEACVLDRDAAKAALDLIDKQNAEASAKKTAAQLKKALKSGQLDPGAPGSYYQSELFPGMSGARRRSFKAALGRARRARPRKRR